MASDVKGSYIWAARGIFEHESLAHGDQAQGKWNNAGFTERGANFGEYRSETRPGRIRKFIVRREGSKRGFEEKVRREGTKRGYEERVRREGTKRGYEGRVRREGTKDRRRNI